MQNERAVELGQYPRTMESPRAFREGNVAMCSVVKKIEQKPASGVETGLQQLVRADASEVLNQFINLILYGNYYMPATLGAL